MRQIHVDEIITKVEQLSIDACCNLGTDVEDRLKDACSSEQSDLARDILKQLIENAQIARKEGIPLCQDTGMGVVFVEIGQDVHITGGYLYDAINEGIRRGYKKGYMRNSVVKSPINRQNTGDNTPAVIHTEIVPGHKLTITFAPKGFGSENMSALKMLTPAQGLSGIKKFVVDTVKKAGANPCPPIVVGVGIGGTMEKAALLSKKSLIRPLGKPNDDPNISQLERELLEAINQLGIGPQGLGGRTTALAVHIEVYPTHIAGLPVAVNMQCHACRHKKVTL
ncbi:MAG TPA: fumarate hydratase [Clostridiales bacterium]|nr:fumarate hydratase [Clostridiales bacterium]